MRKPFVYEQIKQDIIEQIENGDLEPGDRILSQNELSEKYDLSVESVRKALKGLREEDYIYTQRGRGSFVTSQKDRRSVSDSRLVAVVVADLVHNFHSEIARACEDKIREEGYHLLFGNSDNDVEKEKSYMQQYLERHIEGAVIVTGMESYKNDFWEEFVQQVPTTIIDCKVDVPNVNFVRSDDVAGAYEAVSYLISLGHRKIAFIGYPFTLSTSEDRLQGYKKALSEHYISFDDSLCYKADLAREARYEGASRLLEDHGDVTAVFAGEDRIAGAVVYAAQQKGLRVPEDLSVIGYGNLQMDGTMALTTVQQPAYQMGEAATRLLFNTIQEGQDKDSSLKQEVVLPAKLLKKKSTGPCDSEGIPARSSEGVSV